MIVDRICNLIRPKQHVEEESVSYEYCPRCQANLTLQKGYSNDLPYWICKGCGEMLINPEIDTEVSWICDGCGEMLNIQPGFSDDCDHWTCTGCGYKNKIDPSELYLSEDEYQEAKNNPYNGLSDVQMLELSVYQEMDHIVGRDDVIIVMDPDTKKRYIKKLLRIYDKSIYEYLKENPVRHMPRIVALYESSNSLIVLEECIDGRTLAEMIEEKTLSELEAVRIAKMICLILNDLHNLPTPIIHRDIKPSNIILTPSGEVFLLDVNVAKWYDPKKTDDTRHLGTENYAAPEQVGYGLSASSAKSDIYAVGILLNVMLTGKFPKEERAADPIWDIIEQCIKLNAEDRYTAIGLYEALDRLIAS
ncbi:MAG: protein kinase [Lachnospiraceae bacterium]|nr:protein kinase [Lachnospiraceae bacterium]